MLSRLPRWALVAYGVGWLVVTGFVGLVVRMRVPDPAELLRDVADRRAAWIASNAVLIAMQAVLPVGSAALAGALRARRGPVPADALRGLFAVASGALVASGIFHGVLGAHLADEVTAAPLGADLVRAATTVHALGDTAWFVGVGALLAATALCSAAWWSSSVVAERRLARLGAAAVVVGLGQFGWFADHWFGLFAGPGTVLQAAWFVAARAAVPGPPEPVTATPTE